MTTAENLRMIDLGAIANNVRALRACVPQTAALLAVVKADAYGHGAVQVSRAALDAGAAWLAVARASEGQRLREAGIEAPILILGAPSPEEIGVAAASGLTLTVCTPDHIRQAEEAAKRAGTVLDCHLKLDTGMGRIGARDERDIRAVLDALRAAPHVRLTGVFTHFADADGDDMESAWAQLRRFEELLAFLPGGLIRHCANSAAIHRMMPEAAFDMVRMGVSLYGFPPVETDCPLRPAMSWQASVSHVKTILPGDTVSYGRTWTAGRETRVATVTCGYGDGYHRAASGKAQAILHGKRVPVIGRICMDQMMLDVTEIPEVKPGDWATLMGTDGGETITADELASWAGTISYEVLLSAQERVGRLWIRTTKQDIRDRVEAACPDEETLAEESRKVCEQICALPEFREAKTVAAFFPLNGEADIRPVLEEALREGKTLLLPRTNRDMTMSFRAVTDFSRLVPDDWGIPAPRKSAEEPDPDQIDLILMPLCAVDSAGYRLGKGGGCYDRYVAARSLRALRVGVVLGYQRVDTIPTDPWDVPLDACAFPDGLTRYDPMDR